jgi:membrane-associated phospholipid phosphatase
MSVESDCLGIRGVGGNVPAVSGIYSTPQVHRARIRRSHRSYARYGWLLCSAMLLLAVFAVRWLLWVHGAFPGDPWAARLGASHKPWLVYALTRAYQQVGRPIPAFAEVVVMLAWLWRTGGRRTAQGLLIALLASVTCGLIKAICGPTPEWLALHHVGSNFPSGVVTFVTGAGGYLGIVARRRGRMIMSVVVVVLIAGAGPSRVLGGQHLLSDALGGYMLGAAWLIVAVIYLVGPSSAPRPTADSDLHALALLTA